MPTLPTAPFRSLLLLAALFTLLNCCKPLHIDDTAYYHDARQISQHPLDPYGFAILWYDVPDPANRILAPALLPYWWSLAIRLFGESTFLWKLWLFPFALLLACSLYALLRRFARGLELSLTWLTMLSPAFLPGFNLMLDVPALSLSLAAVAVFCRAGDRNSLPLAVLAGLLAGLGMQTKYTGLLTPAVLLLYAWAFRKWGLWLVATVVAVQVFVSWEFLLALLYGRSHFLLALTDESGHTLWKKVKEKARELPPLISLLGSVGFGLLLLGLTALRLRFKWILWAGLGVLCIYVLVAGLGREWEMHLPFLAPFQTGPANISLDAIFFAPAGVGLLAVLGFVNRRLTRRRQARATCRAGAPGRGRRELFLPLWLGLELVGYVFLTPFAAVRRLLGIVVAGTLLSGRLASRTCRCPERRRLIHGIVVASSLLGLGVFGLDWREAAVQKELAEEAVRTIREGSDEGTIWYVGHWGFQYYAERAGMRPVIARNSPRKDASRGAPIRFPPPTHLRRGDWLVFPDERLTKQCLRFDRKDLEPVVVLERSDPIPLRTVMCYYAGRSAVERRTEQTRLTLTIYRVKTDIQPPEALFGEQKCRPP
jgi:hypothetical protein